MKILLFILIPFFTFAQENVHDLTDVLDSKLGGWAIGNACGVDYLLKGVIKGNLDMQNEPLELLNSHLIVEGIIINYGTIVYMCDNSILEVKGEVLSVEKPIKEALKIFPNPAEEEINNKIVDVVYDNTEIYHILEPNSEGVRGISINHFIVRNTIQMVRDYLAGFDQTKIDEFVQELIYNYNQIQHE